MKTPSKGLETESLELARIVTRERELFSELEALKIEKRRRIATIAQLATGVQEVEGEQSMKAMVEQYVHTSDLGTEITTAQVAGALGGNPDVISNYLSRLAKDGILRRIGRGKFIVERTVV